MRHHEGSEVTDFREGLHSGTRPLLQAEASHAKGTPKVAIYSQSGHCRPKALGLSCARLAMVRPKS